MGSVSLQAQATSLASVCLSVCKSQKKVPERHVFLCKAAGQVCVMLGGVGRAWAQSWGCSGAWGRVAGAWGASLSPAVKGEGDTPRTSPGRDAAAGAGKCWGIP